MNKNKKREKLIRDIKKNMTDEQKQRFKEVNKRYRDNMSDEQKQKLRDYQKDYQKNIIQQKS